MWNQDKHLLFICTVCASDYDCGASKSLLICDKCLYSKETIVNSALPMTVNISQATASITELQPNIGNSFSYTV